VIPEETAGPYRGDGTNGPNVLDDDGIVRRDITSSFGTSTTKADGIPATVVLTLVSAATGAPLPGASVYLWHCDRDGRYSIYDDELTDENYLRGVQQAGDDGVVTFTTIFPGCYDGRWPHMHFEVFSDLTTAVDGDGAIATSQLALVQSVCEEVYATAGYEQSATNLGRVSLTSDNIFSDGADQQTPATTGSVSAGYTMALTVPVEV
jgi:protocatechuate 3,4-dioxygenase beta subunit